MATIRLQSKVDMKKIKPPRIGGLIIGYDLDGILKQKDGHGNIKIIGNDNESTFNNGTSGTSGSDGIDGTSGIDGKNGLDGSSGTSGSSGVTILVNSDTEGHNTVNTLSELRKIKTEDGEIYKILSHNKDGLKENIGSGYYKFIKTPIFVLNNKIKFKKYKNKWIFNKSEKEINLFRSDNNIKGLTRTLPISKLIGLKLISNKDFLVEFISNLDKNIFKNSTKSRSSIIYSGNENPNKKVLDGDYFYMADDNGIFIRPNYEGFDGVGYWERILEDDYVTPEMYGAISYNHSFEIKNINKKNIFNSKIAIQKCFDNLFYSVYIKSGYYYVDNTLFIRINKQYKMKFSGLSKHSYIFSGVIFTDKNINVLEIKKSSISNSTFNIDTTLASYNEKNGFIVSIKKEDVRMYDCEINFIGNSKLKINAFKVDSEGKASFRWSRLKLRFLNVNKGVWVSSGNQSIVSDLQFDIIRGENFKQYIVFDKKISNIKIFNESFKIKNVISYKEHLKLPVVKLNGDNIYIDGMFVGANNPKKNYEIITDFGDISDQYGKNPKEKICNYVNNIKEWPKNQNTIKELINDDSVNLFDLGSISKLPGNEIIDKFVSAINFYPGVIYRPLNSKVILLKAYIKGEYKYYNFNAEFDRYGKDELNKANKENLFKGIYIRTSSKNNTNQILKAKIGGNTYNYKLSNYNLKNSIFGYNNNLNKDDIIEVGESLNEFSPFWLMDIQASNVTIGNLLKGYLKSEGFKRIKNSENIQNNILGETLTNTKFLSPKYGDLKNEPLRSSRLLNRLSFINKEISSDNFYVKSFKRNGVNLEKLIEPSINSLSGVSETKRIDIINPLSVINSDLPSNINTFMHGSNLDNDYIEILIKDAEINIDGVVEITLSGDLPKKILIYDIDEKKGALCDFINLENIKSKTKSFKLNYSDNIGKRTMIIRLLGINNSNILNPSYSIEDIMATSKASIKPILPYLNIGGDQDIYGEKNFKEVIGLNLIKVDGEIYKISKDSVTNALTLNQFYTTTTTTTLPPKTTTSTTTTTTNPPEFIKYVMPTTTSSTTTTTTEIHTTTTTSSTTTTTTELPTTTTTTTIVKFSAFDYSKEIYGIIDSGIGYNGNVVCVKNNFNEEKEFKLIELTNGVFENWLKGSDGKLVYLIDHKGSGKTTSIQKNDEHMPFIARSGKYLHKIEIKKGQHIKVLTGVNKNLNSYLSSMICSIDKAYSQVYHSILENNNFNPWYLLNKKIENELILTHNDLLGGIDTVSNTCNNINSTSVITSGYIDDKIILQYNDKLKYTNCKGLGYKNIDEFIGGRKNGTTEMDLYLYTNYESNFSNNDINNINNKIFNRYELINIKLSSIYFNEYKGIYIDGKYYIRGGEKVLNSYDNNKIVDRKKLPIKPNGDYSIDFFNGYLYILSESKKIYKINHKMVIENVIIDYIGDYKSLAINEKYIAVGNKNYIVIFNYKMQKLATLHHNEIKNINFNKEGCLLVSIKDNIYEYKIIT